MPARKAGSKQRADAYKHEHETILRPEAGTQAQFRKKKPPRTYRYDSSLSPALDWDGDNSARELGEWLIAQIEDAALKPAHRFAEARRFGDIVVQGSVNTTVDPLAASSTGVGRTREARRLAESSRTSR